MHIDLGTAMLWTVAIAGAIVMIGTAIAAVRNILRRK